MTKSDLYCTKCNCFFNYEETEQGKCPNCDDDENVMINDLNQ